MKNIYLLTDYNDRFLSKVDANPYRSGNNLELLKSLFHAHGFDISFLNFSDAQKIDNVEEKTFLYTTTEDPGYEYKSFIEDVILYLVKRNARVIPGYELLRANNNKTFLELYRKTIKDSGVKNLESWSFGSYDELLKNKRNIKYPIVIKESAGAMSNGVYLARDEPELLRTCKKISRSRIYLNDIKDYLRVPIYKNFRRESLYRKKFVLQEFIPGLKNDWKVLVYYDKIFVLERGIKEGDFRASGSNFNYLAGSKTNLPKGFLDYVFKIRENFNVPNISLDVIYDGNQFFLIEFQAVNFGTTTIKLSDIYYELSDGAWCKKMENSTIEQYYVESIVKFLGKPT
jgi:glutathione synthase/RimK-type ligase-like ATP-grasp enzyme